MIPTIVILSTLLALALIVLAVIVVAGHRADPWRDDSVDVGLESFFDSDPVDPGSDSLFQSFVFPGDESPTTVLPTLPREVRDDAPFSGPGSRGCGRPDQDPDRAPRRAAVASIDHDGPDSLHVARPSPFPREGLGVKRVPGASGILEANRNGQADPGYDWFQPAVAVRGKHRLVLGAVELTTILPVVGRL